MIVSKKHKALVLRVRDPRAIMTVIPKAKPFKHNGKVFVAVKHGLDEVKVLKNLGVKAPSPIRYYYDWPGRFKPYDPQRVAAEFLSANDRCFNLSSIGTGKSITTLWAFDFSRSQGRMHRALIVAPLSTLELTWADEIFQHFPHYDVEVVHGSRDKRLKALARPADIYLINHDGLKVRGIIEALATRPDIDLVVVDEVSQVARNSGADRWKALNIICNKQHPRAVWGLTGTPIPNKPEDAWAQCKLINPGSVVPSFRAFRNQVALQVSQHIWKPRKEAIDIVHAAMQPSIRFTRDEMNQLPPCTYVSREAPLSEAQVKAYKTMAETLQSEFSTGDVTAVNEAVKAMKLIQIACGAVRGEEGEVHKVGAEPRLKATLAAVEESDAKTIVYVPFRASLEMVADYLRKHGKSVGVVHGGVSKTDRYDIFSGFMRGSSPDVIVAQPSSMSHGLTLTAASTVVWYAPVASNDIFEQANGRITRPGQSKNQLIVMLEGTDIEKKYYERLRTKQKVQGLLLDMIKGHSI